MKNDKKTDKKIDVDKLADACKAKGVSLLQFLSEVEYCSRNGLSVQVTNECIAKAHHIPIKSVLSD